MDWECTPTEFKPDGFTNTESSNLFNKDYMDSTNNWTFTNESFVSFFFV